jgi:hypothetical protein
VQLLELDQVGAGVDLNQHASFCCVALFCAYIDVIKLKRMIVTIKFEFNDDISLDELHENLCLAIHELDEEALDWLSENTIDIIHPDDN